MTPHDPLAAFPTERELELHRALLTRDVTRRLRPVCAELCMSERQFRLVVRSIVDIKLSWLRRRLPS